MRPGLRRRLSLAPVALAMVVATTIAACGTSVTASPTAPSATPTPSAGEPGPTATSGPTTAGPTPVPTVGAGTPAPTRPGQTDTAWGRIWDALPETFPSYPGASPTEVAEGPASATLSLGANPGDPAEVASFYRTALAGAGFDAVDSSGPMEDGSYQVNATAAAGCAAQVTVAPLGTDTVITILYGAACPFA